MGAEAVLQRSVMAWLSKQSDVFAFKVHGSAFQRRGLPDIVGTVGERSIWIELKAPNGRVSRIQAEIHKRIQGAGGMVVLAQTLDEVKIAVETLRIDRGPGRRTC